MDLASVALNVDSSPLARGKRVLDDFGRAGVRAGGNITKSMAGIAGGIAAAAGAVASIGGAVSTLRGFEAGMARVSAVSGATGKDLSSLRDMAKELGATTEFSATQAAGGMQFLAQAGFDAAEILEALPVTLDLATAASVDMATAADIASNILGGFGKEASELSGVADILAKTTSTSNTSLTQLGGALSYAAPLANSAGVSIEEAAAAIGKLSDAGIQGSRAGTSLSGVIRRLQNPSDKAQKALARMGLTLEDVDLKGESLSEVMALFAERGLEAADAATIFEAEAAPGALVMAENAKAIGEMAEELGNAEGSLKKMATTMRDTLDGSFKGLGSAIEGLVIKLGDSGLTGGLKSGIDSITGFVRAITGMKDLGTVAAGIAAVGAAIGALVFPIATASAAIATGIVYAVNNWESLSQSFPRVTGVIEGAVNGVRGALSGIARFIGDAFKAVGLALSGDTRAISLLLTALAHDAKAFGLDFAANMIDGASKAADGIAKYLGEIDIKQAAIDGLTSIVETLEDLTGLEIADNEAISKFVNGVASAVNTVKDTAVTAFKSLKTNVLDFISSFQANAPSDGFMQPFVDGLGHLVSVGGSLWTIAEGIGSLAARLGEFFGVWDPSAGKSFGSWLGEFSADFLHGLGVAFEGVSIGVNLLAAAIEGLVTGDFAKLGEVKSELMEWFEFDLGEMVGFTVPADNLVREVRKTTDKFRSMIADETVTYWVDEYTNRLEMGKMEVEDFRAAIQELQDRAGLVDIALGRGTASLGEEWALGDILALVDRVKGEVVPQLKEAGEQAEESWRKLKAGGETVDQSAVADAHKGIAEQQEIAARSLEQTQTGLAKAATDADALTAKVGTVSEELAKIGGAATTAEQNLAKLEAAATPIVAAVSASVTQVNTELDAWIAGMSEKGASAVGALASGISAGSANVSSAAQAVAASAIDQLSSMAGQMRQVGHDAMTGLAAGMVAAAGKAADAAAAAARKVEEAARDALDTHSPSRVMKLVGIDAMDGLALGIEASAGGAAVASQNAATGVADEFRKQAEIEAQKAADARAHARALFEDNQAAPSGVAETVTNLNETLAQTPPSMGEVKAATQGMGQALSSLPSAASVAGQSLTKIKDAAKKAKDEAAQMAKGIAQDITGPLKQALKSGELSFSSFSDALTQIGRNLLNRLIDALFQPLENMLAELATSLIGGIGGGAGAGTVKGYATGGYTGSGGMYEPAGIVHKNEFVVKGSEVRKPGNRALLERMNRGHSPWSAHATAPASSAAMVAAPAPVLDVNVHNHTNAEVEVEQNDSGGFDVRVLEKAQREAIQSGRYDKAMRDRYGVTPRARGQ